MKQPERKHIHTPDIVSKAAASEMTKRSMFGGQQLSLEGQDQ